MTNADLAAILEAEAALAYIAYDMLPEFNEIVAKLGADQVRANIMHGLRRSHERALAAGRPSGAAMAAERFGIDLTTP